MAAIPGAMESIASLLQTVEGTTKRRPCEASPRAVVLDKKNYEFSDFNLLGLLILKRLARAHDNCWKIGNVQGLLARIIDLTSAGSAPLLDDRKQEARIKTVRRALKVMKILVRATGETGKILRRNISEIVYSVSNIKELLQYEEIHLELQMLGVEILTSLGMDEEAREKIGATGSIIRLIRAVCFRPTVTEKEKEKELRNKAAEALAMLIFENRRNCERMLREGNIELAKLVDALGDPVLGVNAARILRGLCAYSAPERSDRLKIITEAMPMVLKTIMEENEEEILEVSIGLVLQILKLIILEDGRNAIGKAGIKAENLVKKLVDILKRYENPEKKVPRMRRFVIELAATLMMYEDKYIKLFRDLGMKEVMKQVADTTSELECYDFFSGSVGLGRHEQMMSSLVDTALELLGRNSEN